MSTNHVLERGRVLMQRGAPFPPSEVSTLLAAGQDPDFTPATNTTDKAIARFLSGAYGAGWRETTKPRPAWWTRVAQAAEIAAAETLAASAAKRLERSLDLWLIAEADQRAVSHGDLANLAGMARDARGAARLAELDRAVREAERAHAEARDEFERATARVNDLKGAAQRRLADEQLQGKST